MTTTINGRQRKSLAEQIDRLDSILDGLAEALNGAVADAVKEAVGLAVQEAVRGVLAEVLTNPDLLAALRQVLTPPSPPAGRDAPEPRESRAAGFFPRAGAWLRTSCGRAGAGLLRRAVQAACRMGRRLRGAWQFRGPLLRAAAVGTAVGVAAYGAGPW